MLINQDRTESVTKYQVVIEFEQLKTIENNRQEMLTAIKNILAWLLFRLSLQSVAEYVLVTDNFFQAYIHQQSA